MKENFYRVLFSGVALVLTFWGRGGVSLVPAIQTSDTGSAYEKSPLLPQFKNKIYTVASAELLAGEEFRDVSQESSLANFNTVSAAKLSAGNKITPIDVRAGMWLVGDLAKEENIADFNLEKRWPIASLSKLMTAVIAFENIDKNELIAISNSAVQTEGGAGGFNAGEIMTNEDLIKSLMLVSSNDAAVALAEHLGKEKFVNLMNAKAAALGLTNTFFKEPTGLSQLNQSTVRDLKILVRYIYGAHPEILAYSRLSSAQIFDTRLKRGRTIKNINLFASQPDFLGGKTGYTDDAGENLISIFSRHTRTIIIIVLDVLDGKNRFDESSSALQQFDRLDNQ